MNSWNHIEEDPKLKEQVLCRLSKQCQAALDAERSTKPSNKPLVEHTLKSIYVSAGFEPPTVVWCLSPLQAALMPVVLSFLPESRNMWNFRKDLVSLFEDTPLLASLWSQLNATLDRSVDHCREEAGDRLLFATDKDMFRGVVTSMLGGKHLVSRSMTAKLRGDIFNHHEDMLRDWTPNAIDQHFESAFPPVVDISIPFQIGSHIRTLAEGLGAAFVERIPYQDRMMIAPTPRVKLYFSVLTAAMVDFGMWWGYLSNSWLPFIEFLHTDIAEDFNPESANGSENPCHSCESWSALAREAYCYSFFPTIVFVSERPFVSEKDEVGRLHNKKGQALIFGDGFDMFSYNGLTVARDVVMGNATADTIDSTNS